MFASGVIEPSANPGADFYAALNPVLTGGGFTFIESVTEGGRVHSLFRSPDTNVIGEEWVLDVTYYATGIHDGFVWLHVYEDYDSATNMATRGAMYPWAGTLLADGSVTGAVQTPLEDPQFLNPTYQLYGSVGEFHYGIRISDAGFGYWITATPDRVIIMSSLDTRRFYYAGAYTMNPVFSAAVGVNAFPLCTGPVTIYGGDEDDYLFLTRYLFGKGNNAFFSLAYRGTNWDEIGAPMAPREFGKSVGGPRLYEVIISNFDWGWFGSLIDVRAFFSALDFNIGNTGLGISRGDILNVTDSEDPDTTTANQQWVAGFPAIYNGETGVALAMKME